MDERLWRSLGAPEGTCALSWRSATVIATFGLAVLLVANFGDVKLDLHEVFCAQPAREMLASGDWYLPTLFGKPRVEKPPLVYWLIAVTMAASSSHSEFVVRLPSVLAAVASAVVLAAAAARFLGARVGLVTGVLQLTTLWLLAVARNARYDMPLVAAVIGAMCAFAVSNVDGPVARRTDRWMPWVFYLCAGLSALTKGPIGPLMIFAPATIFVALQRDRAALRFLLNPVGLAIFAAVAVSWPIAAYRAYPPLGSIWTIENLDRFRGTNGMDHSPLLTYPIDLVWCMLPWTPFVVMGAVMVWRRRAAPAIWRLLALWCGLGVVLLSLAASKRYHYAAPVMPPLAIFGAFGLLEFATRPPNWLRFKPVSTGVVLAAFGAIVAVRWSVRPDAVWMISALIALLAITLVAGLFLGERLLVVPSLALIFAGFGTTAALSEVFVLPKYDRVARVLPLARWIAREVPRGETIYMGVQVWDIGIGYYLQHPGVRFDDAGELARMAREQHRNQVYVLVSSGLSREALRTLGEFEELESGPPVGPRERLRKQMVFGRLTMKGPLGDAGGGGSRQTQSRVACARPPRLLAAF